MKAAKNYNKMSVYEQVMDALAEGLAQNRGEITLPATRHAKPAPKYSGARVAAIRKKLGMSQSEFASMLSVPKRTLESWEQGRREAKAIAARMLQIVEHDQSAVLKLVHLASARPEPRRKAG